MSKYAYLTDIDWIKGLVKCPCGDPLSGNRDCLCGRPDYFNFHVEQERTAECERIFRQMFEWYDHSTPARLRLYKVLSDYFGAGVDHWESKCLIDLVFAAELMLEAPPKCEIDPVLQAALEAWNNNNSWREVYAKAHAVSSDEVAIKDKEAFTQEVKRYAERTNQIVRKGTQGRK